MNEYKLTHFSHGAGCGCKISPELLEGILQTNELQSFKQLLVGNQTKDDAAVFDLDGETAIISTTDFFMPIVDDPFDFGAIAATNAISDIYAMGGKPIMAIAILGWPINKLPIELAGEVLRGGRDTCKKAGIPLAGGHSIDAPEPIFGLAVTGIVPSKKVKRNCDAQPGDLIYLTKALGVGMVSTAQKKGLAEEEDLDMARSSMLLLNDIGTDLSTMPFVHALTDVTGFGLGGHLLEMCEGSGCQAEIWFDQIPRFSFIEKYSKLNCIPGGTDRNWDSYGSRIAMVNPGYYKTIADPQTSGGLLIAVDPVKAEEFEKDMAAREYQLKPIGVFLKGNPSPTIVILENKKDKN